MTVDIEQLKMLAADFDKADIHWRAQSLTRNGDKALALAYLDARNVMERLDQVCGMENWQDRYEVHGQKTICYISIKIGDEWVTKSDGAGDTKVEAEKGSISDAFKRAAVKWGIGRYLYSMGAPWVPCKTYEDQRGNKKFSEFIGDPWDYIKGNQKPKEDSRQSYNNLVAKMQKQTSVEDLGKWVKSTSTKAEYGQLPNDWKESFNEEVAKHKASLTTQTQEAA